MMICPSAPMFQNRILKASVTPSAEMSRGIITLMVPWKAILLRNAPSKILA